MAATHTRSVPAARFVAPEFCAVVALEKVRGRAGRRGPGNRPGLLTPACRTRRPRHLAAPGRGGAVANQRRPKRCEVRRLPGVPRAVFIGLLRATPGGLTVSGAVPFGVSAYPPLVGRTLVPRHGPAGVIAPDAQGRPLVPSGARLRAPGPHGLGRCAKGVRLAPVTQPPHPAPRHVTLQTPLEWDGISGL